MNQKKVKMILWLK